MQVMHENTFGREQLQTWCAQSLCCAVAFGKRSNGSSMEGYRRTASGSRPASPLRGSTWTWAARSSTGPFKTMWPCSTRRQSCVASYVSTARVRQSSRKSARRRRQVRRCSCCRRSTSSCRSSPKSRTSIAINASASTRVGATPRSAAQLGRQHAKAAHFRVPANDGKAMLVDLQGGPRSAGHLAFFRRSQEHRLLPLHLVQGDRRDALQRGGPLNVLRETAMQTNGLLIGLGVISR